MARRATARAPVACQATARPPGADEFAGTPAALQRRVHKPSPRHLLLSTLCLLLAGCDEPEPEVTDDEDAEARNLGCVAPTAGMVITQNTVLCSGTYAFPIAAGNAAITIAADDVTLTCLATRISNQGIPAPMSSPNVGIRITGRDGVTVDGCAADNFRYGLVATDATDLTLTDLDLDDNFTDPTAGWVFDDVQGGGLRLERVHDAIVHASSFARNWNGLELRSSDHVQVHGNVADHCTNTAALLLASDHNDIADNDLSWAIRGPGLAYPANWYGVETFDSAGILLDAGSTANTVESNDITFGGDGIFARAVLGGCAHGNTFTGNDASYSPHNAIESWCDDNNFIANDASFSHYGRWLGGSDRAVVRGNTIAGNRVDGISMQIAEGRHTLIESNTITDSGRAGILITGRQYQAGDDLETHWDPNLANSSQTLIQRNYFDDNAEYDVFTTSTRGIVTASNCAEIGWIGPNIVFYDETELSANVAGCIDDPDLFAPEVTLADPGVVALNTPVQLHATLGWPGKQSKVPTSTFNWVVQPSGERFLSGGLPPLVYGQAASNNANPTVTFTRPGAYDVDVTAYALGLGGMTNRQITVAPPGTRIGTLADTWGYACTGVGNCVTTITDVAGGVEGSAVKVVSDAPFGLVLQSPAIGALNLNASQAIALGFFARAKNPNGRGWQGANPVVRLIGTAGSITNTPAAPILPTSADEWVWIRVPLAGGEGWTRVVNGGSLADIDRVELTVDTWGSDAFELTLDALSVY